MATSDDIRQARERLGEDHAQFARRFDVNRTTVYRWETNGPPLRGTTRIAIDRVLAELPVEAEP